MKSSEDKTMQQRVTSANTGLQEQFADKTLNEPLKKVNFPFPISKTSSSSHVLTYPTFLSY